MFSLTSILLQISGLVSFKVTLSWYMMENLRVKVRKFHR